ncbi:MAG: type IV toxin-antitoxin system AbiEi family antitoxin domain-containing protein, partial [Acidimicrobiia bacterium]|nr:type IV toxin-antitoxin system AbiEi family antitoxin domain-containing protein [Acidimicrobiia bacterium]
MDLRALDAQAADHHGLLTRDSASRRGMSKATWFRWVAQGRLIEIHPGVARLPGALVTREQEILAAVLAVAPQTLASHRSAAYLWGIARPKGDPIELIVTRRTRTFELPGVIVHRPRDLKDLKPVLKQGIPTTNILRLLCDLGAVDPAAVPAAVGHVVTSRLASPVALRQAVTRHARRGRHGVPALREALEEWVIDGKPVDSALESAMRTLFERHHLPPYEFHARIGPYEVDFRIIGTPIVLECDGWEFHAKTRWQQAADAARDAHLAELGFISVRVTYHQIVWEHAKQARRIIGVIRRWAPELDLGGRGLGS